MPIYFRRSKVSKFRRLLQVVCWIKDHAWKYKGGLFAKCSRCYKEAVYVGDGLYAGDINEKEID